MIRKCQEEIEVEQDKQKSNLSLWKGRVMLCARPAGHSLSVIYMHILLRLKEQLEVLEGVNRELDLTVPWLLWAQIMGFVIIKYHTPSVQLITSHYHGLVSSFDTRQVSGRTYPWGHCFDQIWMFHPGLK